MDLDEMDYSKAARFFPNECYVCKGRYALKLCKCNMISYCDEDCRLEHLTIHKPFCKAILELLKEKYVCHIYDELAPLYGTEWNEKRIQIYDQLEAKLGRPLSSLEHSMFYRPRLCFECEEFNEYLQNCPHCPIATFCEEHQGSIFHYDTCEVMRNYIKLLNITDELNIDLQFLPSSFPFITEETKIEEGDPLTYTMRMYYHRNDLFDSWSAKINLCNFICDASKFHKALEIIAITVPSEIIIHIKAFHSTHAIVKENYWEFLLHSDPNIKLLKIVITGVENLKHSEISLCKNCRSMEKTLLIEIDPRPYEEYMLNEDYKVPNILFYYKIDNLMLSEEIKKWSQYHCSILFKSDSKKTFNTTKNILEDVTTHQIIHKGRILSYFDGLSISKWDELYIILKPKGNFSAKENIDKITEKTENKSVLEPSADSNDKLIEKENSRVSQQSRIIDSETKEVKNDAIPKEIETQHNFNTTEIEDELTTKRKHDSDVESVSSSSSSSFIIIPESVNSDCNTEKDANKDKKSDENKIVLESTVDDSNVENEKLVDKNIEQNLRDKAKKNNEDQIITFDLKNLESEGKVNFSELFLMKHISFLVNENKRQQDENKRQQDENKRQQDENKRQQDENKRQQDEKERNILILQDEIERLKIQLTSSVEVVTKLQSKIVQLQEICSNMLQRNKLIEDTLHVNNVDINSVIEEKIFKI